MMKSIGFYFFVTSVLLVNCEKENVLFQESLPSASSMAFPDSVTKGYVDISQIYQNVNKNQISTQPPEANPTNDSGPNPEIPSTDFPSFFHNIAASQMPEVLETDTPETLYAIKENNNLNEIFTEEENLFNQETLSPEVKNVVKDFTSTPPLSFSESRVTPFDYTNINVLLEATQSSSFHTDTDKSKRLRLEPWKIGVISATVFFAVETVVLIVYCFICRKRRRAILTKSCEQDSEACETINVESNDNTLTDVEGTINGLHAQHIGESSSTTGC